MKISILVKNEIQMLGLGQLIGQSLAGGEIVTLSGPLGAGKTTLSKAILLGAGVTKGSSPTFIVSAAYSVKKQGPLKEIHHLDLYRLKDETEILTTGLYDIMGHQGVAVIVEWADRFPQAFKNDKINIVIKVVDKDQRSLNIEAGGAQHEKILNHIRNNFR